MNCTTYKELHKALESLNLSGQGLLDQRIKFIPSSDSGINCIEVKVTTEPFLQHRLDASDVGYPSELEARDKNWNLNHYKVIEPEGTVLLIGSNQP